MKKIEMPIGQKVRGYGLLNEYGEFDFIPEQTGIRQGQTKLIKGNDEYTLSETKKMVIVHIRLSKGDSKLDLLKEYLRIFNIVLEDLREYEF
jgi:hypothetical protein